MTQPQPTTSTPNAYESLELTRDIVKDTRGVYALRVKGDGMIDALIADGDIVILRRVAGTRAGDASAWANLPPAPPQAVTIHDGDMVAVWIKSLQVTTLKRWYSEGARVRLQPENAAYPPMTLDRADCEAQGKVIAVIRNNLTAKTEEQAAGGGQQAGSGGYQPRDARRISEGETAATGNARKRVDNKLQGFDRALFDL